MDEPSMLDRRRLQPMLYAYHAIVILLLFVLLVVGFFHYTSLSTSQKLMLMDLQQVRQQYVQLQTYITGQSEQDKRMDKLQRDLDAIRKMVIARGPSAH